MILVTYVFSAPMQHHLTRRSNPPLDLSLANLVPKTTAYQQPLSLSYPIPTYMGPQASIPYVSGFSLDSNTKKVLLDSVKTPFPAFSYSFPRINNYANTPYLYLG